MSTKKKLVVIDGKSVFYRGYYAMPNLSTKDGKPTGGVYGFAVMGLEVLKKMKPDYVCVAWDKPKTNIRRRREIYPAYKANRKPAPPDFYEQVPILHQLLDAFGWPLYEIDDHEADDIMATFAKQASTKEYETVLISSDHDLLQLVSKDVTVATLKKGLTNIELFDPEHFKERYEMTPEQFVDYKSLRGDPSDNLPGVAGVGEKTAIQLIKDYKTLDGVYEHIDEIKGALQGKLTKDKDAAYITKQLVLLEKDVDMKLDWKAADVRKTKPETIANILKELEFRTLLRQLPETMQVEEGSLVGKKSSFAHSTKLVQVQTKAQLKKMLLSGKQLFVHAFCGGAAGKDVSVVLVGSTAKEVYAIDIMTGELDANDVAEALKSPLEDDSVGKIGYDLKLTFAAFLQLGVDPRGINHDVRMSAFLLNSLIREQALTKLAQDELGYEGQDLDTLSPSELLTNADTYASVVWALFDAQQSQFKKVPRVAELAKKIEWPVMEVLARMEVAGIGLDSAYLKKMSKELEGKISDVEQLIYGHADSEFNIASPAQLSDVLFNKMELSTTNIKKTKTSYSTAASELDKLRGQHPIIDLITQFREYSKLKSTYVDTLPEQVDENGRLHTTFSMAVAPTGRLSSHNPNLQNIPVRSELGKHIRTAFVARKGHSFVSADYSQFELRLAAVLAKDDELIESFNDGLDIHQRTAAQVYGVALEDVTKSQRRDAKVINFGILYGMSPHGLSVATGMSQIDAKKFIDKYFDLRKPLLDFIDRTKELAKDQGYVETMFGRRRPTPDVKSSNFVVREAALRAAVNMPIQGTEADLMKLAMIDVDKKLDKDCNQLLQIHDSILVECPEDKAEDVGKLLKHSMENVYKLAVNLDVDVSVGKNWGEL